MQLLDLDLKPKLLWQVCRFHQEVTLLQIVYPPSSATIFIHGQLVDAIGAHVGVTRLFFVEEEVALVNWFILVIGVAQERPINMRCDVIATSLNLFLLYADLRADLPVLVDRVQSALHELAALQEIVNMISEDVLAVDVSLDFEEELATSHAIRNLNPLSALVVDATLREAHPPLLVRLAELLVRVRRLGPALTAILTAVAILSDAFFHPLLHQGLFEVEAQHESFLLEAFVIFILKICYVHILLLGPVLDRKLHLAKFL